MLPHKCDDRRRNKPKALCPLVKDKPMFRSPQRSSLRRGSREGQGAAAKRLAWQRRVDLSLGPNLLGWGFARNLALYPIVGFL